MTRLRALWPQTPSSARALAVALGIALSAAPASAAARPPGGTTAFHADPFAISPAPGINLLDLATSDVLRNMWPAVGFVVDYARAPVTLTADGPDGPLVSTAVEARFRAELHASFGFADRVDLALAIPFVLGSTGGDLAALGRPGVTAGGSHMGDIRATPKVRLLDPGDASGFGLALGIVFHIPTGSERAFASYGALLARPFLVADWRDPSSGLLVTLNLAYGLQPEAVAGDVTLDDTFRWGLGVRSPPLLDDLAVVATISGRVPVVHPDARLTPVEAALGVELRLGNFIALAGAGGRFRDAVGSAELRVFAGFGYVPIPRDSDGDGILDHEDVCPFDAEDLDGVEDDDGCPDLP